MHHPTLRTAVAVIGGALLSANAPLAADASTDRQSLDDAWWTGPILAASASSLPQGRYLIEPYVYDVISNARFDARGERRGIDDTHHVGSLTYMLYGLTDTFTVGVIPRFGFNDVNDGRDSSGLRVGDFTVQGQYRLTQFQEGRPIPTISLVLQATLPTGKYDQLGDRPSDGVGGGAYSTTIGLYSQHFFWLPTGRILRARLNLSHTLSDDANLTGVSVYGTDESFRGRARPGDSFAINLAGEYSLTRNWVLALDLLYQRDASTHVSGTTTQDVNGQVRRVSYSAESGSSRRFGVAPAIEYNFSPRVGVIVGARWFPDGRNVTTSFTPVAAVNIVY